MNNLPPIPRLTTEELKRRKFTPVEKKERLTAMADNNLESDAIARYERRMERADFSHGGLFVKDHNCIFDDADQVAIAVKAMFDHPAKRKRIPLHGNVSKLLITEDFVVVSCRSACRFLLKERETGKELRRQVTANIDT